MPDPQLIILLAEAAQRSSLAQLHATIEGIPEAVVLLSPEGRYELVNEGMAKLVGLPADEIVGRTVDEIIDLTGHQLPGPSEVDALADGPVELDFDLEDGGRKRTYATRRSLCSDAGGRVLGFVGVAHEVTDRRAIERDVFPGLDMGAAPQFIA